MEFIMCQTMSKGVKTFINEEYSVDICTYQNDFLGDSVDLSMIDYEFVVTRRDESYRMDLRQCFDKYHDALRFFEDLCEEIDETAAFELEKRRKESLYELNRQLFQDATTLDSEIDEIKHFLSNEIDEFFGGDDNLTNYDEKVDIYKKLIALSGELFDIVDKMYEIRGECRELQEREEDYRTMMNSYDKPLQFDRDRQKMSDNEEKMLLLPEFVEDESEDDEEYLKEMKLLDEFGIFVEELEDFGLCIEDVEDLLI